MKNMYPYNNLGKYAKFCDTSYFDRNNRKKVFHPVVLFKYCIEEQLPMETVCSMIEPLNCKLYDFFSKVTVTMSSLLSVLYYAVKGAYFVVTQFLVIPVFITLHLLLLPIKVARPSLFWTIDAFLFEAAQGVVTSWLYVEGVTCM